MTDSPFSPSDERHFEALLAYLKEARAFDFTAYKRATLQRRVHKRMQVTGIRDLQAYRDHLEAQPDEFRHLFSTILINVTGFFRDPPVWDYLAADVLPRMLRSGPPAGGLRVWSAASASGEEAYTIAMLLAEALGLDGYQRNVKIYATDVDDEALAEGRVASYSEKQVSSVPDAWRAKYFSQVNGRFVVNRELRRNVIFGRHDLLQDAPISRVSLLTCRNTFMYFHAEAQMRILERLAFALLPGAVLVLGKAELLLGRSPALQPLDLKRRVFIKVGASAQAEGSASAGTSQGQVNPMVRDLKLRDLALDADPVAQFVLDPAEIVVMTNAHLRSMFGVEAGDVGRPFKDLEISFRPVELRSMVARALAERRADAVHGVEWTTATGEPLVLDLHVTPLTDTGGDLLGVHVVFRDVTPYHVLQEELRRSNQELETAYEELQSTNEELETTNEELQSTVEELETTNEELQSTNEELETMNEELQSTNEELHGANVALRGRGDELNQLNSFLETILTSLEEALAVVDHEFRVRAWNARAYDLWGLRSDEVQGVSLLSLDIGLPVEELRRPLRACLTGESSREQLELWAVNRRGKTVRLRVVCSPLTFMGDGSGGSIILMLELPPDPSAQKESARVS